uniref:Uncharacterized protein n=1 Tax=Arundo donax TaxID=35708 RepID=A0A0A9H2C6_ARUDO
MNHGMRLSMFKEYSRLKLLAIADTRFCLSCGDVEAVLHGQEGT